MDKLNLELTEKKLISCLKIEMENRGFSKVVLGLSGGIDSALSAYIATKALGAENVIAFLMPYKTSSKESLEHAKLVVNDLGINHQIIEITPMVDVYFELNKDMDNLRKGNRMARERMCILFDNAAKENALVLGTSNKTEILLGYSTLFGDSACSLNPIGNLYKTYVWELSRHMGIPSELIDKKPSADLWEGQTDEMELGFSYNLADEILYQLVEEFKTEDEIVKSGYPEEVVKKILTRIKNSQYKRNLPKITDTIKQLTDDEKKYLDNIGV